MKEAPKELMTERAKETTRDFMADRRSSTRHPLVLSAEIIELPGFAKYSACSSDVSRGGCYIDTINPLPTGSSIRVRLFRGSDILEVGGKVVYTSPRLGMGITFDEPLHLNQLALLDRWVEELSRAYY
jgi:PilZ domain